MSLFFIRKKVLFDLKDSLWFMAVLLNDFFYLNPCGETELEKMCLIPRLLNKGVTVALYWDVKCLWFHSSNFALNVCQNNTKMIYFDKIVQPLNSFWCFLFSCPYQCVALQVSGFPTGLFVALLVSGSLYLRVTTCVCILVCHAGVSCLCVCVSCSVCQAAWLPSVWVCLRAG